MIAHQNYPAPNVTHIFCYDYILMIAHQNYTNEEMLKVEGYDYILMIAHQNLETLSKRANFVMITY